MKKTRSTLKYKFLSLLFSFSLTCLLGYALFLSIKEADFWFIFISALLFILLAFYFVINLYQVQWIVFNKECVSVFNIFGLIKKIPYEKIKKAYFTTEHFETIKRLNVPYRECIVICETKSHIKASVFGGYNTKKNRYVIFENSAENLELLLYYYKEATKKTLEIK